ncbi:MAG: DUF2283 domain-containing protein [Cyanobacteria bacterium P01_D01_bin.36]
MDTLQTLDANLQMKWDYDSSADVLYMAIGEPQPALSVDIGEGLVLRYSEAKSAIVGFTIIGLKARLDQSLESVPSLTSLVSSTINQYGQGDNIAGDKVLGDKINTQINNSQDLAQATRDIKALFAELDQTHDKNTPIGQMTIATETVKAIEGNPTVKKRLINALKEGSATALEEAIEHPAIKPVVAAIKGYIDA